MRLKAAKRLLPCVASLWSGSSSFSLFMFSSPVTLPGKGNSKIYLELWSVRWILPVSQAESPLGNWAGSWGCWSWRSCHCWSSARGSPRRALFSGDQGCCVGGTAHSLKSCWFFKPPSQNVLISTIFNEIKQYNSKKTRRLKNEGKDLNRHFSKSRYTNIRNKYM